MTYEAMNVDYVELSSSVSLAPVDGEVRRPMRVAPKVWAEALKNAKAKAKALAKLNKPAKAKKTAAELQASRTAALEKARATRAAKPKVAKVAKPKAVAELSEKASRMLAALRSIADAEGNIVVASIDCAGVSGRSIGALLSVLSRRSLYTPGKKGFGVVKMPA